MIPIPYLRLVAWGMVAGFLVIAAVVAVAFPIHASDALTFGTWSRLISEHWHFNEQQTGPSAYSRPLFYALQGWLWAIIGYSDVSGRLLCGLFSLLLVAALAFAAAAMHEPARAESWPKAFGSSGLTRTAPRLKRSR